MLPRTAVSTRTLMDGRHRGPARSWLEASALVAVPSGRCTSPSFRERPEGLRSLVACLFNRQADVGKEMVFSISQLAERTPLAAAFDPDLDRRRQLCEKKRDKARSSQDRCSVVTSRRIG